MKDTGIGIDTETQAQLFQPFAQADGSITRRYGGTGLGLAISKSIVELMQGTIGVESELGRGATFWVELDFAIPPQDDWGSLVPAAPGPEPRNADRGQAPIVPRQPRHVLLAEDNEVNQKVACAVLARLGCTFELVEDGEKAIEASGAQAFDLVLMDCMMPGMDGYEATRLIRAREQRERLPRTPIVALTANATAEDEGRCLDVGMDDYLRKPYSAKALEAKINRWTSDRASL